MALAAAAESGWGEASGSPLCRDLGGEASGVGGTDRDAVSYHDAGWYGSWAAVWHYARAWLTPLHGRQLARVGPQGGFQEKRSLALLHFSFHNEKVLLKE